MNSADWHLPLPDGYQVDDAMTASMARAANNFIQGMSAEGIPLDYTSTSADALDPIADMYVAISPDAKGIRAMAISMGAYVGEIIVRTNRGRWVAAIQREGRMQEPVAIQLSSGLVAFPLTKANKRLSVGPEHSLRQFVDVALSGTLPPEARRVGP